MHNRSQTSGGASKATDRGRLVPRADIEPAGGPSEPAALEQSAIACEECVWGLVWRVLTDERQSNENGDTMGSGFRTETDGGT